MLNPNKLKSSAQNNESYTTLNVNFYENFKTKLNINDNLWQF